MDKFHIVGPTRLVGRVQASGAKNAALPALAASLLTDDTVALHRVPRVRDIRTMQRLLDHLGVGSEESGGALMLRRERASSRPEAPYDLVKTMRAGVLVLGPLVARHGFARVSLPGGCAIGVRPIDQHLKGLDALGAEVRLANGYVEATAERLIGTRFRFDLPTVTGTENLLLAACLVLAGGAAAGATLVDRIYHLDRGYEGMELKLQKLGARVERVAEIPAV